MASSIRFPLPDLELCQIAYEIGGHFSRLLHLTPRDPKCCYRTSSPDSTRCQTKEGLVLEISDFYRNLSIHTPFGCWKILECNADEWKTIFRDFKDRLTSFETGRGFERFSISAWKDKLMRPVIYKEESEYLSARVAENIWKTYASLPLPVSALYFCEIAYEIGSHLISVIAPRPQDRFFSPVSFNPFPDSSRLQTKQGLVLRLDIEENILSLSTPFGTWEVLSLRKGDAEKILDIFKKSLNSIYQREKTTCWEIRSWKTDQIKSAVYRRSGDPAISAETVERNWDTLTDPSLDKEEAQLCRIAKDIAKTLLSILKYQIDPSSSQTTEGLILEHDKEEQILSICTPLGKWKVLHLRSVDLEKFSPVFQRSLVPLSDSPSKQCWNITYWEEIALPPPAYQARAKCTLPKVVQEVWERFERHVNAPFS